MYLLFGRQAYHYNGSIYRENVQFGCVLKTISINLHQTHSLMKNLVKTPFITMLFCTTRLPTNVTTIILVKASGHATLVNANSSLNHKKYVTVSVNTLNSIKYDVNFVQWFILR